LAVPKYFQLETVLLERMQMGALGPGAKLPPETELASRFGVSRSTVRKVLDRLAQRGLITKWPGKGSFVSSQRLSMSPTSLSFSAQMIADGYTVKTRVLSREVIPVPDYVARFLGLSPQGKVIHFRRLRMLDGEPVAIHGTFLAYLEYDKITAEELERTNSLSHAMEWATGVRVVSSRDVLSVVRANSEDAALLNIPPHSPVVSIRGVGQTESGTPVRYTEAIYRSDRFEFTVYNTVATNGSWSA